MSQAENSLIVTVKLIHVFGGIYIWEWVSTVQFEWEVLTGQRPFRWSFIAYEITRTLCLASIVTALAGFNLTHRFNCEAWFRTVLVFSYFAIAFTSSLILLRGVAIWGRSLTVLIFTACVWLANFGIAVYSVMKGAIVWIPSVNSCFITKTEEFRLGITSSFATVVILLSVMMSGVLNKRNATGLWRVLYIQGLTWMFIASASEFLPTTFTWLNINDGWNLMFQVPHMVTIVIMATRVYRDLFEYINPTCHAPLPPPRLNTLPSAQVQVTVHKTVDIDLGTHISRSDVELTRGEREAKEMQFVV